MATSSAVPQIPKTSVDVNALRSNQASIVAIVAVSFILGAGPGAWLITALAVSLGIGAARPGLGPIQLLYRHLLLGTGIVKPKRRPDDPTPHRFAQAMGAIMLILAALLLFADTSFGWVLAWLVAALALVNLAFAFCAGCFIFLQLRRLGIVR